MAVQLAAASRGSWPSGQAQRGSCATLIDINFGCPVKKVVNGHAGRPDARRIACRAHPRATVKAVDLPVTLKMRTGWDDNRRNAPALAKSPNPAHPHGHGARPHALSFYAGKAIGLCPRGQGGSFDPGRRQCDITSLEEVDRPWRNPAPTGHDRPRLLCRPWFIAQVIAWLRSQRRLPDPPLLQQYRILHRHYDAMLSHYGTPASISRASISVGIARAPGSAEFRAASTAPKRRPKSNS